MEFIETSFFTKFISSELLDDEYRKLQNNLIENPEIGKVVKGSNGIRKIRWNIKGKGKRGGLRIIYYIISSDKIGFLYIYKKAKQTDLTSDQIKIIKFLVEDEFK